MKYTNLFFYCLLFTNLSNAFANDTLSIYEINKPLVFDGMASDSCWQNIPWNGINNVWMPWGTTVDTTDFYARFKVAWSAETNLLYFLVEITDDIVSDGYEPGKTMPIYNFDMFEVFIDEDHSGGYHVFDGCGDNDSCFGENAENAFAYHIFCKTPGKDKTGTTFRAEDMGGKNWRTVISYNYTDHFPDFVYHRTINTTTWEFSLKVYDASYNRQEKNNQVVKLAQGKLLGLSLACNDDDEPKVDPKKTIRDTFIGSVAVTEEHWNDHWMNADGFGVAKLEGFAR